MIAEGPAVEPMLSDELMREVKRLELRTRRRVDSLFAGNYHSSFKGQGIEFAEVREYEPGDDVRAIDWNVSARAGKPYIKQFVEERQLTVLLAVDISGSTLFGTRGKTKGRLEIEVAAALAAAAAKNQDRVGLLLFAERPELFIPPRKGRTHLLRVFREMLAHRPEAPGTDIASALEFLGNVQRKRAIVFLVSDLLGPQGPAGYDRQLRRLAARHELTVVRVHDPAERVLPRAGLVRLSDAETGRSLVLDASSRRVRDAFSHRAQRRDREIDAVLTRSGAEQLTVRTDMPFMPTLAAHFARRSAVRRAS